MSLTPVELWKPGTCGRTPQGYLVCRLVDGALLVRQLGFQAWSEGELQCVGLEATVDPNLECQINFGPKTS